MDNYAFCVIIIRAEVLNKHVNKSIKLLPCGQSQQGMYGPAITDQLNINPDNLISAKLLATYYSGSHCAVGGLIRMLID